MRLWQAGGRQTARFLVHVGGFFEAVPFLDIHLIGIWGGLGFADDVGEQQLGGLVIAGFGVRNQFLGDGLQVVVRDNVEQLLPKDGDLAAERVAGPAEVPDDEAATLIAVFVPFFLGTGGGGVEGCFGVGWCAH